MTAYTTVWILSGLLLGYLSGRAELKFWQMFVLVALLQIAFIFGRLAIVACEQL